MMRILMIGADSKYAIERPYLRYLAEDKCIDHIEFFAAQNIFLDFYRKNKFNKIIYRLGLSRILHDINEQLKAKVAQYKPDIVFIFKGMEVLPATLQWMKAQGIKLANYNPDNPFIFSGRGSGNKHITRSIPLFDLFMSYDKGICKKMQDEYLVRSELLPFGFDISDKLFEACTKEPEKRTVCFIGNTDTHRLKFLNELAASGVEIDLYGMNWRQTALHENINFLGPLFEDDLWKALRSYRVQLNLLRIHNPWSHNMRSFEIPGAGGIQLAPYTPDHAAFFEEGKEIFLFKNVTGCVAQIKKLLALSSEEADNIRTRSRQRAVSSGYTYKDRAAAVALYLNDLNQSR